MLATKRKEKKPETLLGAAQACRNKTRKSRLHANLEQGRNEWLKKNMSTPSTSSGPTSRNGLFGYSPQRAVSPAAGPEFFGGYSPNIWNQAQNHIIDNNYQMPMLPIPGPNTFQTPWNGYQAPQNNFQNLGMPMQYIPPNFGMYNFGAMPVYPQFQYTPNQTQKPYQQPINYSPLPEFRQEVPQLDVTDYDIPDFKIKKNPHFEEERKLVPSFAPKPNPYKYERDDIVGRLRHDYFTRDKEQVDGNTRNRSPVAERRVYSPGPAPKKVEYLDGNPKHHLLYRRGDYAVYNKILGEGSYCIVYQGVIQSNRQRVAVKEIKSCIDNELHVLRKVFSEYIIKLIDDWVQDSKYYIVLEKCEGSLRDKLRTISQPGALGYFSQILKGMQCLHKCNIIHRDIKLQNILVHSSNKIKISDFGFAKDMGGQLEVQSIRCGTPSTMAPEIYFEKKQYANYEEKKTYDTKCDVWALGIVLHELLYKTHPFQNNQHRLRRGIRTKPSVVVAEMEEVIERALVTDPNRRCSLSEMNDAFGRALKKMDARKCFQGGRNKQVSQTKIIAEKQRVIIQPAEKDTPTPERKKAVKPQIQDKNKDGPAPVASRAPSPPKIFIVNKKKVTYPLNQEEQTNKDNRAQKDSKGNLIYFKIGSFRSQMHKQLECLSMILILMALLLALQFVVASI